MAAANVISVIGTAVSILSILLDQIPSDSSKVKVSYYIANDGGLHDLSNAGGDLPDVRHWDETAEFIGGTYDPGYCGEGATDCSTDVSTNQGATYTLFTGNDDAICIAWTSVAWAGGHTKFAFHPGNWAHACDTTSYNSGHWYYANQVVPGIDYEDEVYCAWVDRNGDIPTTGFQVHWPEFDRDKSDMKDLDYYCRENPPVYFHEDYEPDTIYYYTHAKRYSPNPRAVKAPAVFRRRANAQSSVEKARRAANTFSSDPRLIKSFYAKHKASELCDRSKKAVGQSFVSYAEQKLCYMPTKTLYSFCSNVKDGACWDDEENKLKMNGDAASQAKGSLPDLSHIKDIVIWGEKQSRRGWFTTT